MWLTSPIHTRSLLGVYNIILSTSRGILEELFLLFMFGPPARWLLLRLMFSKLLLDRSGPNPSCLRLIRRAFSSSTYPCRKLCNLASPSNGQCSDHLIHDNVSTGHSGGSEVPTYFFPSLLPPYLTKEYVPCGLITASGLLHGYGLVSTYSYHQLLSFFHILALQSATDLRRYV